VYTFTLKHFKDLTVDELYAILQLREAVFVVEQNCVYQDIDGLDEQCYHLFALSDESKKIIAYARLVPVNSKFDVPSIGRVISNAAYRNLGLGKALMTKAIDETWKLFECNSIKIAAQMYLLNFYSNFGFKPISDPYDEDGIEHLDMLLLKE
jgi:ElaA protein